MAVGVVRNSYVVLYAGHTNAGNCSSCFSCLGIVLQIFGDSCFCTTAHFLIFHYSSWTYFSEISYNLDRNFSTYSGSGAVRYPEMQYFSSSITATTANTPASLLSNNILTFDFECPTFIFVHVFTFPVLYPGYTLRLYYLACSLRALTSLLEPQLNYIICFSPILCHIVFCIRYSKCSGVLVFNGILPIQNSVQWTSSCTTHSSLLESMIIFLPYIPVSRCT